MSDPGNYGGQCPEHYLPLPCTACHAQQTWPAGGFQPARANPLGPNYQPPQPSAPAPLTHEARARAWVETLGQCITNEQAMARLAAAFAGIAEQARRELVTEQVVAMTAAHVVETRATLDAVEIPNVKDGPCPIHTGCEVCVGKYLIEHFFQAKISHAVLDASSAVPRPILAATPGSCRVCGLASCMHPPSDSGSSSGRIPGSEPG